MRAPSLICLIFVFVFTASHYKSNAKSICSCTPEECERDPVEFCVWGEARDYCGRRVCAKGPGERCGGPVDILGVCGEGMMCKRDERCHGCSSITYQCHP